jgi:hypothetical protein
MSLVESVSAVVRPEPPLALITAYNGGDLCKR